MIKKIKEYYESEYNITKNVINSHSPTVDKKSCVWYAIQRCLGVAQFAQSLGISFEEAKSLYEEYRKNLEKLLDKLY